jgi:hypothetical protein
LWNASVTSLGLTPAADDDDADDDDASDTEKKK